MPFITAHQKFPQFFNALDPKVNPGLYTPWQGNVVRQSAPRWMARPYRFTGTGSVLAGARWSVKGLMLQMTHRRDGTVIQTLNQAALPPDMHGLDS